MREEAYQAANVSPASTTHNPDEEDSSTLQVSTGTSTPVTSQSLEREEQLTPASQTSTPLPVDDEDQRDAHT